MLHAIDTVSFAKSQVGTIGQQGWVPVLQLTECDAEKILDLATVVTRDDYVILIACGSGAGRRRSRGGGDGGTGCRVPVSCRQDAVVDTKFKVCTFGVDRGIYAFEKVKGDGLIERDELASISLQRVS